MAAAAVVAVADETDGDKRLIAYVVSAAGADGAGGDDSTAKAGEWREQLRRRLPHYMVPAAFVELDRMPLTPNGKVDRRALPAPGQTTTVGGDGYVAPRTAVEQTLALMWGELLRVEKVGIHDDFFDSGGHSLLAAQLSTRLRVAFKVELPLRKLFEAPTICQLARLIEEADGNGGKRRPPVIAPVPRETRRVQIP